jgi:hypothetical protein
MGLFSNPLQDQGKNSYNQAFNTANMFGSDASGIGASLTPFLTQEMLHPQGLGQQGLSAEEAAATGGAGGAGAAFSGIMAQRAGASRNAGGFQAGADDASRNAAKAAAGASEGIAAGNENLKQQQMQEGSAGLGKLYGTDTSAMTNAMGQEHSDIAAELAAQQAGPAWMTDASKTLGLVGQVAGLAGGFGIPGLSGFTGGK